MASDADLASIRLLIADTDDSQRVFDDDQLTAFYELEGESVRGAAALALQTHAINVAVSAGPVRQLLDLQLDPQSASETLMAMSKQLRAGTPSTFQALWMSNFEDESESV